MGKVIKLLIVDDEEYVVSALKRHLSWDKLGIEVVGEAYGGKEGIEKALQLKPDCVLTDISMPSMDGISMIEQLYLLGFHPYFLIYTGYNDFEYAKRAIKFGVCDYILKPALPEEIEASLALIVARIQDETNRSQEHAQLRKDFEDSKQQLFLPFLSDLLEGRLLTYEEFAQKDQFFHSALQGKDYVVVGIHLDNAYEVFINEKIEDQLYTLYHISSFASSLLPGKTWSTGFMSNTAYFLCAVQTDTIDTDKLIGISTRILNFCNQVGNLNLSVRISISETVHVFDSIATAYRQAKEYIRESSGNQVISCRENPQEFSYSPLSWAFDKEAFIDAILLGNEPLALNLLDQFFKKISQLPPPQDIYLTPLLCELVGSTTVTLLQHGIESDPGAYITLLQKNSTIHEAQTKVTDYFKKLIETIQSRELAKNYQVVQKMMAFTRKNYRSGITLNEIAEYLQFTPNYLSTLFSKSTGISYSHYLTKFRMQKAKEFLESGRYKVYEVGDLVGYHNPEYFTKVFKEFVGVPPSSYVK
ncbi:response regulator containing CheY-like receiver domain and AraC-type DNA-binding domain [Sphaerochaeta pleomorpha str. Grapes]|uniref:Response regulator containing CheY-like receiver domain and AraC-type DNA-binding domain n=1 Tax=Sphaerochaeta pleomorpha (strain ATCC BAA-1885 / DSM 22778 / Grapes) TaxID=158190 RepID=G8QWC9_SPHPG|nr:response regulator [Sphaerochaeta pleomorpha]AEV29427.1 response regulator containing CheY-like receiver domain and AraC-type DNA-binding domain [Sphaerochaeta pleomorpha str. Grapes]